MSAARQQHAHNLKKAAVLPACVTGTGKLLVWCHSAVHPVVQRSKLQLDSTPDQRTVFAIQATVPKLTHTDKLAAAGVPLVIAPLTSDSHHPGANDVQSCTPPLTPQRILQLHPIALTPVACCTPVLRHCRPSLLCRRPKRLDAPPIIPCTPHQPIARICTHPADMAEQAVAHIHAVPIDGLFHLQAIVRYRCQSPFRILPGCCPRGPPAACPLLLLAAWWPRYIAQHCTSKAWVPAAIVSTKGEAQQVPINVHDIAFACNTIQHLDVTAGVCQW